MGGGGAAPSSSNVLLPAGCSVARDGALLRALSCMLNTRAPCRILQFCTALLQRGWGGSSHLPEQQQADGERWKTAGHSPAPLDTLLGAFSPQTIPAHAQPVLLLLWVLLECNCSPCRDVQSQPVPDPWGCLSVFLLPSG